MKTRAAHRASATPVVCLKSAVISVLTALALLPACEGRPRGGQRQKPVFRAPFVLKLRLDRQHYYEQKIPKVPYVANDNVYLFAGDSFGADASIADGKIPRITYQPNAAKADVEFSFFQQRGAGGLVMILVIQNRLKRRLFLDALMTIPGKNGVFRTDILPIPPGLTDYESWPHPIVQLVLRNFRFSAKQSASKGTGQ